MKAAQSWKFHPNQKSKVSNRARYYLDFFWNRKKKRNTWITDVLFLLTQNGYHVNFCAYLSIIRVQLRFAVKIKNRKFWFIFLFFLNIFFPATFSNSVSKEWPYHLFLYMHVYLTVSCFVWFSNGPIRKDNLWGGEGTKHCGQ